MQCRMIFGFPQLLTLTVKDSRSSLTDSGHSSFMKLFSDSLADHDFFSAPALLSQSVDSLLPCHSTHLAAIDQDCCTLVSFQLCKVVQRLTECHSNPPTTLPLRRMIEQNPKIGERYVSQIDIHIEWPLDSL